MVAVSRMTAERGPFKRICQVAPSIIYTWFLGPRRGCLLNRHFDRFSHFLQGSFCVTNAQTEMHIAHI